MKKIILASASPRRKELLEKIGLKFEIEPSDYQEESSIELEPHELARRNSLGKARDVAGKYKNAIVIGADTFGVLDGKIIGKPWTESEARKMLGELSGKSHVVVTGFTVIDTESNKIISRTVETKVYIKKLNQKEIDAYVRSGEPLGKAGGYAIQGLGSIIVERIEGDFFSVVGLPLSALADTLSEFGIKVL